MVDGSLCIKEVCVSDISTTSPRRNIMNRYRVLGRIGDGAYGSVILAIKIDSGEKVAIKRFDSFQLNSNQMLKTIF